MTEQKSPKEIVLAFMNSIIEGKVREAYDKYVSPNFRHHNPYFKGDRETLCTAMEEAHHQFPEKQYKIQRALEDGDLVAVHSSVQLKTDMPTIAVVHIFRLENNLIVEEWEVGQEVPSDLPNENGMF